MNYDEIVDGFERALELERELGVRTVECDRELLKTGREQGDGGAAPEPPAAGETRRDGGAAPEPPAAEKPIVFLHHAALSAGGVGMMAKIIGALKLTVDEAPIVFTGELPAAKRYIVLGGKALAKWFPAVHAAPGNSFAHEGREVYVTYSPEYILKFKIVTPAVNKIKAEMWKGIKGMVVGGV